ncbi:TPA: replication/maintenance protein RepL [Campylobacter lari]|nr:replication/maintenance protein RepL [Campylobacter lari]
MTKPIEDINKESGVKTRYIGTRKVRDIETGEVIELEYLEKEVSHTLKRGWRRVYLENFMELLTGLYSSSKKIDVIEFILENLNSENQLTLTQAQVIQATGISKPVIIDTFRYLRENDFMKKVGAVYVVNPKFVCAFGSDKKNQTIAIKYCSQEPSLFDEN